MAPLALGSDTGGSVRQPASFCGIAGLKPTYGRVSRLGLVAFGSSLDQIGPLAKTAHDCALALAVMAGADPGDSTAASRPVDRYAEALDAEVRGLTVGLPREFFGEGLDPEVEGSIRKAAAALEARGTEVRSVALPHARFSVPVYYLVATAEASSNLARYDGVRYGRRAAGVTRLRDMYDVTRGEGFGAEVKRRIMLGTFALSAGYHEAFYGKALRVRTLLRRDFDEVFAAGVDVLICPTSPTPPFRLGEKTQDPLSMYLSDIYTVLASLAGLPAISVASGLSAAGLPIGLQIIGPAFGEAKVLQVAAAVEEAVGRVEPAWSGAA
jgi:aspartyl-tRNA(Asn)/glutamyl-tRNA(Gln) amidotransferase subunit A